MTTHHNGNGAAHALPDISRADRARFVKLARQLRAAQIDRLLLAAATASPGCGAPPAARQQPAAERQHRAELPEQAAYRTRKD